MRMRRLFLVTAAFLWAWVASALHAQAPAKSPFVGVWAAEVAGYGTVALEITDNGHGQVGAAGIWWFVELRDRSFFAKVENNRLTVVGNDLNRKLVPYFVLELAADGKLHFVPGGFIADPLPSFFTGPALGRISDPYYWHRLTSYLDHSNEYTKWHDHGALKDLPESWPTELAEMTARLFASDDHLLVRAIVLPSLSENFLAEAYGWTQSKRSWNEGTYYVPRAIARNPSCGQDVLEKIWQTPNEPSLWLAVAANPHAKPEWSSGVVDRIMASDENVKARAAREPKAPPELFHRLIPENRFIREDLARTSHLPTFVYEQLARDYWPDTASILAQNDSLPAAVRDKFVESTDPKDWRLIIYNRTLSPDVRARLVAKIVALADPREIERFASDRDTPPTFLRRYADELDPQVRRSVALNPGTDEDTLLLLANDQARATAHDARAALGRRFPAALARVTATLVPLEKLDENASLSQQFDQAVDRSDLNELARLADYLRPRGKLEQEVEAASTEAITAYRPEVMDFLLAQGLNKYGGALTDLAGRCDGNRQWLEYFKAHGALEGDRSGRAYAIAIEAGSIANVKGLIAVGADVNQTDGNMLTPLHIAVARRNMEVIELLLKSGAKTDLRDQHGLTALNFAVLGKYIPAIRLLDRDGKYANVIADFSKEFPSAPKDSRLVDSWTNNRDGFSTVVITLGKDGTGRLSTPVAVGLLAWHTNSETEIVAYLFDAKGEVDRNHPLKLVYDPKTDRMTWSMEKNPPEMMTRYKR
ncbi:MAG TPA: ankyrin repeat domain-containing protein [Candidatus Didemnitutus sp.]|nr:ankyrin repeat domain-containing protein [Candidatus Didemnitutus sp.]